MIMPYQQTRRLTVITITNTFNHNPIHPRKQSHAASTANSASTQQHYRVDATLAVHVSVVVTLLTNSATLSIYSVIAILHYRPVVTCGPLFSFTANTLKTLSLAILASTWLTFHYLIGDAVGCASTCLRLRERFD